MKLCALHSSCSSCVILLAFAFLRHRCKIVVGLRNQRRRSKGLTLSTLLWFPRLVQPVCCVPHQNAADARFSARSKCEIAVCICAACARRGRPECDIASSPFPIFPEAITDGHSHRCAVNEVARPPVSTVIELNEVAKLRLCLRLIRSKIPCPRNNDLPLFSLVTRQVDSAEAVRLYGSQDFPLAISDIRRYQAPTRDVRSLLHLLAMTGWIDASRPRPRGPSSSACSSAGRIRIAMYGHIEPDKNVFGPSFLVVTPNRWTRATAATRRTHSHADVSMSRTIFETVASAYARVVPGRVSLTPHRLGMYRRASREPRPSSTALECYNAIHKWIFALRAGCSREYATVLMSGIVCKTRIVLDLEPLARLSSAPPSWVRGVAPSRMDLNLPGGPAAHMHLVDARKCRVVIGAED
ncbi:hypothetical protein OE88DRAFT_1646823 [Heliocybe sulcata]|uniref:Uncharacterized protein n=1 Tax=Heliocybe sulcata TaxID=5364 RepID=A0A5C3MUE2_9AGAM|nr:hypothetical protein OE88DRAFT_1646823 [Heliocybe sulcata]